MTIFKKKESGKRHLNLTVNISGRIYMNENLCLFMEKTLPSLIINI